MELLLSVMEISGFDPLKHPTKILFGFDKISLTIILSSGLPFFITF